MQQPRWAFAIPLCLVACGSGPPERSSPASLGDSPLPRALLGINIDPRNAPAFPAASDVAQLGATGVRIEFKVAHTSGANDDGAREAELQQAMSFYDAAIARYTEANI